MKDTIEDIEKYLDLKTGFFNELQNEDDWSFIIKFYSLIETSTTYLLVENLHPELLDAISLMQMGTQKNGKLAFIKALKLLPDQHLNTLKPLVG